MQLTAEKREPGKASALRRRGLIPAVIYNKEFNIPVSVELRAFDKVFRVQGSSNLIELEIDGEHHDVLVKAVQMDKRRREPQHVDFYAVTAGQTVEVHVPIYLAGVPVGVKNEGGLLDQQRREVLIRVLPRLIPHGVELDVSGLGIGDALHVRDLLEQLPAEAEVVDDLDTTILTVVPPRVEEEPAELVAEAAEPQLIGEDDGGEDESSDS